MGMAADQSVQDGVGGYAPRDVQARYSSEGTIVLQSCVPPGEVETSIVNYLEKWAGERPGRTFLAQRAADRCWETVSYAEAWRRVQGIAQGLIDAGHQNDQPVMILSPASIEHGLLMLAAMLIGAPVVPVSPTYSLLPEALPRLAEIAALVRPAFVFVRDGAAYAGALAVSDLEAATLLGAGEDPPGHSLSSWYDLAAPGEIARRRAAVGGDTIAKILFTSGSTGTPKGVINTHSMLCHAVCSTNGLIPDAADGPVLVDWMPWHHTMGGNSVLHGTLRGGGTLYIDDGKPIPGAFERSIENLRDGRPTTLQTVPAAYRLLVDALERDADFRTAFFSRMERLFYAGASLPADVWHKMQSLAVETRGEPIDFGSALGTTETGPGITITHWASDGGGEVGLPVCGAEVKLLPVEGKFEIRVRGPMVTPGYFRQPELTRAAFDAEGFYRTGDLVDLVDRTNPAMGLRFAGRLSENFKLANGSWVTTSELRLAVLDACAPLVADLVLAGTDRPDIRAMLWAAQPIDPSDPEALLRIGRAIAERIAAFNRQNRSATRSIAAFRILHDPPSLGTGETSDKGYVNQRRVLLNRSGLVDELYDAPAGGEIFITLEAEPCQ
jgi:feruloyl-CoA synthase